MMSVSAIRSAASAGHYFEQDDYYVDGLSPSAWVGSGAVSLGLTGEVDRQQFRELLEGRLPTGEQVGTVRDGEWKHQPGVDLTFSAPKTVSILAEVAGDQRLLQAHDRAVQAVLSRIEQEHIVTRVRDRAEGVIHYETPGSMVAARFQHTTSRALDPQLHTHSVVMNLTQRADGEWRSIENKPIFLDQKHLGLVYRQYLAAEVQGLGYEVEHYRDGTWEVAGIQQEVIRQFSKRSEAIGEALEARGVTRETATAAEKEVAALDTRDRKLAADRGELLDRWHAEIGEAELAGLRKLINLSRENKPSLEHQSEHLLERVRLANEAVMWAAEHLGERDSSWSLRELIREAARYGGAGVLITDLENAVAAAANEGALLERSVRVYDKTRHEEMDVAGFTSRHAIEIEDEMIREEYRGRSNESPMCSREHAEKAVSVAEERARDAGYEWNDDQRLATVGILTSRNSVTGIQGLAGTAKTNSVLRTVADTAAELGHEVKGLTPTNSAAQSLAEGAGIEARTIQSHLAEERNELVKDRKAEQRVASINKRLARIEKALGSPGVDESSGVLIPESSPLYQDRLDSLQYEKAELMGEREGLQASLQRKPEVWIVDEASMVGTRLMRDLLQRAGQVGAKVVLTGDVRQLASVEAGAAFRQLQNEGMQTYRLEEIVRQTNRGTRDAVYLSLMKRAASALNRLQESGSVIKELQVHTAAGRVDHSKSGELRRNELVTDFMSLSREDRANSLILEPSREGRGRTNELVREQLRARGELGQEIKVPRLAAADATEAERRVASSYKDGQIVRFARNFKREGVRQGIYYEVVGREGSAIILREHGKEVDPIRFTPERYAARNIQIFDLRESSLAVGERIVWRDNDKSSGRLNNELATVMSISEQGVTFRLANGKELMLDASRLSNAHWDHGYAMTVHAAQGKTASNVFIHAESNRESLLNTEQFYVQLSRAKDGVYLYTDNRERLVRAVEERTGQKQAAREPSFQPLASLDHLLDKVLGYEQAGQSRAPARQADHSAGRAEIAR